MLPVERVRGEVLAALEKERRLVITAPTGSGKSTRVPLWLSERFEGPTIVVEPRRVACRSLAGFLASEDGTPLGERIGYSVRFDERAKASARLIYVTTGVALRWLDSGRLTAAGCLVLDEFHERRWETDLLLAVVVARYPELPIVVTSATLDAETLAAALDAPIVRAEGRTFPVDVSYAAQPNTPTLDGLEGRVASAVSRAPDDGDVLVFLPGKREIRECSAAVRRACPKLEVVPVHGGIPPGELAAAFRTSTRRRAYLATNVAETSVTLPGVTTVIDSGLSRRRVHRCGRSILALDPIARSSMDQRAGRAGRVQAGRCFRLWSERYRAADYDKPEVERIELDELVLRAAVAGVSGDAFDNAAWVTSPPGFAVTAARDRLRELGVLSSNGKPAPTARDWLSLPVGVQEGLLLGECPPALLSDTIDLVAVLDGASRLLLPPAALGLRQQEVDEARAELFRGLADEPSRLVRALRRGSPKAHGLRSDVLSEVRRVAKRLRGILQCSESGTEFARDAVALHVASRWPRSVFVARARTVKRRVDGKPNPTGEAWGNGEVELRIRRVPTLGKSAARAGIVLDQEWLSDGATAARGVGGVVLPLPLSALAALGMGEARATQPKVVRGRRGARVVAQVEREFAGVVVSESEERLCGDALLDALPELVLRGSLFKAVRGELDARLHTLRVAAQWDGNQVEGAVPDSTQWLRDRFEALGVVESSDLQLVEAEDLLPDLEADTGLSAWELDSLQQAFPATWTHDGATYRCEVLVKRALVRLVLAKKATKRVKDPPRGALPKFRGFAVELRDGSRVVRLR